MGKKIEIWVLCIFICSCQYDENSDKSVSRKIMHEDWYKNGQLESRVWYNNELNEDSLGLWFYENGNPKIQAQFKDGKQIGPSIYYFPNGNVEIYCFYNDTGDGSVMYLREFNEKGELIKEAGVPIGLVYKNGVKIKPNNYFDFSVVTATPPDSKMAIYVSSKENTPDFVLGTTYHVKDKMPFFKHYFKNRGEYPMMVISELKDTVRNTVRRDTIEFSVTVE